MGSTVLLHYRENRKSHSSSILECFKFCVISKYYCFHLDEETEFWKMKSERSISTFASSLP